MHAADGGKDIARRAAELCGGAIEPVFLELVHFHADDGKVSVLRVEKVSVLCKR